jgi:hypothetical protein
MTLIKVPDLPRPVVDQGGKPVLLCYQQDPATFWRCTKKAGHSGPHTWQLHAPPE